MKKTLPVFVLWLCLSSCIRDESQLLPPVEPQPVLNMLQSPEIPFVAYAGFSKGILDTTPGLSYEGAKLAVYENDVLVDSMMYIDSLGLYVARQFSFPLVGKCYSVRGTYATYPLLQSGSSCVPGPVPLQPLLLDTAFSTEENRDTYRIGVLFNDPAPAGDLYQLTLYRCHLGKDGLWRLNTHCIRSGWQAEFNDRELCGGLYFDDSYLLPGAGTIWLDSGIGPDAAHHDSLQLIVELKHASEDYYRYALSYARYLRNKGSLFAQPAPVHSNISNGFGIFGTLNTYRDTIRF